MKRNFLLSLAALLLCSFTASAQNNDDRYKRCVILEEFTTENCPNCPPVARAIEELMDDPDYNDIVIPVTHHSGFYTDFLTTPADTDLRWFYNYKSCYAPGIMFDRYPFFMTRGGKDAKPTAVGGYNETLNLGFLKEKVDERMAEKSHVALDLTGTFDGESVITVNVTGERDAEFTEGETRIWVYLIEDNIKSQHQKGADASFVHQHTLRTYNKVWGDKMTWNGNSFEYECDLTVDAGYKQDDLKVIAFVSAFDPDDAAACVIENARSVSFQTLLGIDAPASSNELVKTEYFTIDGVKTIPGQHGLYIEKKTYADGSKDFKKVNR